MLFHFRLLAVSHQTVCSLLNTIHSCGGLGETSCFNQTVERFGGTNDAGTRNRLKELQLISGRGKPYRFLTLRRGGGRGRGQREDPPSWHLLKRCGRCPYVISRPTWLLLSRSSNRPKLAFRW